MPTDREREYYRMGFSDGLEEAKRAGLTPRQSIEAGVDKANSKKPRFRYRNGKLNLKKMAVSFRKTPAGKKKRR